MKNKKSGIKCDTLKIGIAYNLKSGSAKASDAEEEYDTPETINALKKEIRRLGYIPVLLPQKSDFLSLVRRERPDFVLNIAEGRGCFRSREAQVPSLLEMEGIPYSGSDPLTLALTLDKYMTNRYLKAFGVPVPHSSLVGSVPEAEKLAASLKGKDCRLIVKPCFEGSSKGVLKSSLVKNRCELAKETLRILTQYHQPAVVEEFLPGEEITAGVAGNEEPEVLGMMTIGYRKKTNKPFLYSLEVKRTWEKTVKYEGAQGLRASVRDRVSHIAKNAFRVLGCRDISRIDFRLDGRGNPFVIEINPLPGLSPVYSDLPILYRLNGHTYSELVEKIINAGLKRCGLAP
jgi:D-alanine-D-alanine ligase